MSLRNSDIYISGCIVIGRKSLVPATRHFVFFKTKNEFVCAHWTWLLIKPLPQLLTKPIIRAQ